MNRGTQGPSVEGEFADVKYENGDHGIYEYLRRTALSNPHAAISFTDPEGKEFVFERRSSSMPERPEPVKPHPLGLRSTTYSTSPSERQQETCRPFWSTLSQGSHRTRLRSLGNSQRNRLRQGSQVADMARGRGAHQGDKAVKWIAPDATQIKADRRGADKDCAQEHTGPRIHACCREEAEGFQGRHTVHSRGRGRVRRSAGKKTEKDRGNDTEIRQQGTIAVR